MSIDHLPRPAPERHLTPVGPAPAAGPAWRPTPRPWSPTPAARASLWLHGLGLCALAAWPAGWPWVAGAIAANHAILGLAGMWPRSRMLGPNLLCLPEAAIRRGEVALTFDDGPDPAITPRVLDLLEAHGATASFFLIGRRALHHPALAREILCRGHDIGNHTYRHPHGFACWGPGAMWREIMAAQRAIADTVGAEPRFFRPPLGLRSPLLDPALAATGLDYVSWTRRGLDGWFGNPDAVLRRLTRGLAAGDILLLHDAGCVRSPSGRPVVLEVLPALLDRIRALGLRPVSLRQALDDAGDGATAAAAGVAACPAPAGHACP